MRKHGFDFSDVAEMFSHPLLVAPDTRDDYGEKRWRGLGWISGVLAHVVFVEKQPDLVRIISLRKATRREHQKFKETIYDGLEAD